MSFLVDTRSRTEEIEIMDDFSIQGKILHDALDKLATINQLLGGNSVTLNGLERLLKNHNKDIPLTIIDLGCGGGDILKAIARFGRKKGYNFQLIGIDANKYAVDYAIQMATDYENVKFMTLDVFSDEFKALKYDVMVTTLFLHHFREAQLLDLLNTVMKTVTLGVVVNDLHRHRLAYYLFKLITVPVKNQMIVEDGLTSVLRGFKKKELLHLSKSVDHKFQLRWKWAFRFQWIIWK